MRTRPDVTELRDFYHSPLGRIARRLVNRHISARWSNTTNDNVYGIGFASPYLDPLLGKTQRIGAFMPAKQGVIVWPPNKKYKSLLVDETELPLSDSSADKILLVHCLETADSADELLREIWRVLSPSGSLLVIVPNRRGIWARFDTTPFGHGTPYSRGQLIRQLQASRFAPEKVDHALFAPPAQWRMILKSAPIWERAGQSFWPAFSGLLIAKATKELLAPIGKKKRVLRPNLAMPVPAASRSANHCSATKRECKS